MLHTFTPLLLLRFQLVWEKIQFQEIKLRLRWLRKHVSFFTLQVKPLFLQKKTLC